MVPPLLKPTMPPTAPSWALVPPRRLLTTWTLEMVPPMLRPVRVPVHVLRTRAGNVVQDEIAQRAGGLTEQAGDAVRILDRQVDQLVAQPVEQPRKPPCPAPMDCTVPAPRMSEPST